MDAFKAWFSVVLFGGLGMASLLGFRLPRDPTCEIRCRMDTLAELQAHIGNGNTALIMFACAVFSWFWYKLR